MEKEDILKKSRNSKIDEGYEYVASSICWSFLTADSYEKYKFFEVRSYNIIFVFFRFVAIVFLILYIVGTLG